MVLTLTVSGSLLEPPPVDAKPPSVCLHVIRSRRRSENRKRVPFLPLWPRRHSGEDQLGAAPQKVREQEVLRNLEAVFCVFQLQHFDVFYLVSFIYIFPFFFLFSNSIIVCIDIYRYTHIDIYLHIHTLLNVYIHIHIHVRACAGMYIVQRGVDALLTGISWQPDERHLQTMAVYLPDGAQGSGAVDPF